MAQDELRRGRSFFCDEPELIFVRLSFCQVRALALVHLRKRVLAKKAKQWLDQSVEVRTTLKALLLELVVSESSCVPQLIGRSPSPPDTLFLLYSKRSRPHGLNPPHQRPRPRRTPSKRLARASALALCRIDFYDGIASRSRAAVDLLPHRHARRCSWRGRTRCCEHDSGEAVDGAVRHVLEGGGKPED
jgi:hypothetical protein